jgi:CheY-like chemotaxis protein
MTRMTNNSIMLIEDDADDQLIFMELLSEISPGFNCIIANNGVEALTQLKNITSVPDLIFIDLNMPLMNGFECLTRIKMDNRFNKVPVIIFTTSDNPLDQAKTLELGANRFLTKTPNLKLLKKQLMDILVNHSFLSQPPKNSN